MTDIRILVINRINAPKRTTTRLVIEFFESLICITVSQLMQNFKSEEHINHRNNSGYPDYLSCYRHIHISANTHDKYNCQNQSNNNSKNIALKLITSTTIVVECDRQSYCSIIYIWYHFLSLLILNYFFFRKNNP